MRDHKPVASLSLDLDNQWSYMKTHGDPGWESFPSYLDLVVPRALRFLEERNLTITFFIVGQDAALEKNRDALRAIAEAGHEIGNHSFHHQPWVHLLSEKEFESELVHAEEHILRATGQKPVGYRGPGYSLSDEALQVLARRGYRYDASTLPTFIGPLCRLYYLATSNLSPAEKKQRSQLFGTFHDGLRSLRPYWWRIQDGETWFSMLEIPVTTIPILRAPFHISYVLYLSTFSPLLALLYFRSALMMCRMTEIQPSLLLHPLDFLGADDLGDLAFFPAMRMPRGKKAKVVEKVLDTYCRQFQVVNLNRHARAIKKMSGLSMVEPSFGPTVMHVEDAPSAYASRSRL